MTSWHRDERGLSLIETLAALTIFAVITLGITPLIGASIRASTLSRSYTQGKDLALQAMERIRGLPYYVAYQSQSKKVDVLDMYFPCADPTLATAGCVGEGTRSYDAVRRVFTLTCSSSDAGPSCAVPLVPGYSLRYEARFVRGDGSTTETPLSTYRRDPSSTQGSLDAPPSQLLELKITAFWVVQGRTRSQVLTSLIGARKFGPIKMAGLARVSYGAQVLTSYAHTSGDTRTSDLKAIAGISESQFQTRLVSTARQSVRGTEITLIRRPTDTDTEAVHLGVSPLQGVVSEVDAPPNQAPAPAPVAGATFVHPNLATGSSIAFMSQSTATGVTASTSSQLPSAGGTFALSPTADTSETSQGYFWVNNQVDPLQNTLLKLDTSQKVFSLKTQSSTTMQGSTSILSTGLGATRQVRSQASMSIKLIRAMPVSYLTGANDERQVIVLKDFAASLDCNSKGDITSTASGSWSATFKMWNDPTNNGSGSLGTNADAVPTNVTLSGALAATTTSVQTLLSQAPYNAAPHNIVAGNPLIYDGATPADDVYLFKTATQNGYITDFTISPVVAPAPQLGGDLARASIEGAIHITTVPTNPLRPESGLNISIGSLSCEALDQR